MIRLIVFVMLAMAVPALPLCGQAAPDKHYPITPRLVARALSIHGMQTEDEQVSLPTAMLAAEAHPDLDILSVVSEGEAGSTVKLACHPTSSCLPFFAQVSGLQPPVAAASSSALATAFKGKPEIAMRSGTHAVLVMDDHLAFIQIVVVTLESGEIGKWIRVASPDHKQFYRAEVVSPHQLRGDF